MDPEEDESEKIKRTKVMQFMNPKMGPTRKPVQPKHVLSIVSLVYTPYMCTL